MRRTLMVFSALAMTAVVCGGAQAQKLDANGRCHGANGQFAKAAVCGAAGMSAPARSAGRTGEVAPAAAAPPSRAADPIKCRNAKGKFAKCGSPGAHPA